MSEVNRVQCGEVTEYKYITYFITAVYLLGSGDTLTVPFSQSSEIKCIP